MYAPRNVSCGLSRPRASRRVWGAWINGAPRRGRNLASWNRKGALGPCSAIKMYGSNLKIPFRNIARRNMIVRSDGGWLSGEPWILAASHKAQEEHTWTMFY